MQQRASEALEETLQKPDVHERWESAFRTPANRQFYDEAFDFLVKAMGLPEGAVCLDAGCGTCDYAIRLAKRGMVIVAVDFSESVLRAARRNVARSGVRSRITLRRENLLSLGIPDETFDVALCWGVLMHIPDVERAVSELARVVRRGGMVIVSEGNMSSVQSVLVRALKRLLGKHTGEVKLMPAGLEYWDETPAGALVTREADIPWLVGRFERNGLTLRRRIAGQWTELYTRTSSLRLQRLIHGFNHLWFKYVRLAAPAFGNILILQKRA